MSKQQAVTMRQPATANLMISSYDRAPNFGLTAGQFGISEPKSLLNGYFTRIGTTEVAMNYQVPNVVADVSSNYVRVDISGVGIQNFILPVGNYTSADALNTFVSLFNAGSGGGRTIAVTSTGQNVTLTMTGGFFRFPAASNNLIGSLGFSYGGIYKAAQVATISPLAGIAPSEQLQPIRYLDFVCTQLTYNQNLQDASTDKNDRNVLCRWYMNYDNDMNQVDSLGYPIVMGMKGFYIRRTFNPPKQIRWSANQPIGQLLFEVYKFYYDINTQTYKSDLFTETEYEWLMTLQVSED